MADLQVEIVTPRKAVYSGKATEVRIPAWDGEMGVLPGHDIVLALLRGGVLTLVGSEQGDLRLVVGRGFVEVGPDRVTILADVCERAEEVDKNAASAAISTAEETMIGIDTASVEYKAAEERVEVARARLAV